MIDGSVIPKLSLINELSWPSKESCSRYDNGREPTANPAKCEEMFEKIRADRPDQVINEVFSFKEGPYEIYWADVDMLGIGMNTVGIPIGNIRLSIPYPLKKYTDFLENFKFAE